MQARIVLLGTGSSASTPSLACLACGDGTCVVCPEAQANPASRNRRGNPSLLVSLYPRSGEASHVLVDCGKTFQQSAVRFFPQLGVKHLDAVVLTHDHADAVLGLDDIRDMQPVVQVTLPSGVISAVEKRIVAPLPVYLSKKTDDTLKRVFPYLRPEIASEGSTRFVSKISWIVFDDEDNALPPGPIDVCKLSVLPVRLEHGTGYTCYGFIFGPRSSALVYFSDVSAVPDATAAFMQENITVDTLVIDSLFEQGTYSSHMCLDEALVVIALYRPRRSILVGMSHSFDYYNPSPKIAAFVAAHGLSVEMGFDGLVVPWDFAL